MWKITKDQIGRELRMAVPPRRIVSLVPSQTELLSSLGLDNEVVGITKFCVHPEGWFRSKQRVGGTKNVKIDLIRQLEPDLVIANKEENTKEDVEAILGFCPVWTSDIVTIQDALGMIRDLGDITDRAGQGEMIASQIEQAFHGIPRIGLRAAYLIWKNPYMAAGGDTYISQMMELAGLENVFADASRYPEINIETLKALDVELMLLSSEPYPFKMNDIEDLSKILPDAKAVLVDGEMFSWYGSRMLHFPGYIEELIGRFR